MTPIRIQVIPGLHAKDYGYTSDDPSKPLEDYSLILLTAKHEAKDFKHGLFIKNTQLPLKAADLEALRFAARNSMDKQIAKAKKANDKTKSTV